MRWLWTSQLWKGPRALLQKALRNASLGHTDIKKNIHDMEREVLQQPNSKGSKIGARDGEVLICTWGMDA